MSKMWEVDPETKAKLQQYSKTNNNDRCCDCGAPSPQWASPKFGTFICLNCAGTHRGLGVHISFVRSITMDAFKTGEIARMEHGGNEPWKTFFDNHPVTLSEGRTFEDSTIKERYDGEVGEEWKERLAAKAEGREYVPGQRPPKKDPQQQQPSSRSSTPLMRAGSGRGSPASQEGLGRSDSRKERNEAYFARLGDANNTRSASLPPSQGGKFTGFGGGLPAEPAPVRQAPGGNIPGLDDFQKDPVASLTKGFGWFTTAVGKSAKNLNDSYLQPTAKTIAESEFAAQARLHASTVGQNLQTGARGAADQFQRFVEGPDQHGPGGRQSRAGDPDHKDFWDDFSSLGEQHQHQQQQRNNSHRRATSRSNAIGTAAMKPATSPASSVVADEPGTGVGRTSAPTSGAGGEGKGPSGGPATGGKGPEHKDGWDDEW
ncbi:ArfGap-domain-containing protein [Aspergillus campestris IBT 28561]|uniref:ArfGap-domain-containing protein n=1 Tax=Aspergillus campestris (strain IBT 28561) TaxID=1392248 RepID=A0A2I1DBM6_ASPC2|nr:ArfGap-domain-containing protein [Aspergillus campestris IBT 28561]PKY07267.1 ArfGap-domain-containing protein [Aspergillus campestris IBT 28561]